MKSWPFFVLIAACVVGMAITALAQTQSAPSLLKTNQEYSAAATKACLFPPGGWTIIDCSEAASATSAQLNAWSRYVIQCGVNSYLAWGDEVTDAADANDGYLGAGAWLEFGTDGTTRYVACLNVTTDDDCRYIECK